MSVTNRCLCGTHVFPVCCAVCPDHVRIDQRGGWATSDTMSFLEVDNTVLTGSREYAELGIFGSCISLQSTVWSDAIIIPIDPVIILL
jgi:hypothetical protein